MKLAQFHQEHTKNVIESKYRVIRDIYLRLKQDRNGQTVTYERLLIQQALRISNDLYGSDVCSAQETAKGYTRPANVGSFPATVPQHIFRAHDDLLAKRKLTRISSDLQLTVT